MKKIFLILILVINVNFSFAFDDFNYITKSMSGFTVKFKKSIEDIDAVQVALETLKVDLAQVSMLLSDDILRLMRENPIWIRSNIEKGSACYHPAKKWLVDNGVNPDKAECVEIVHYKNYVDYRNKNQDFILLHELAHLYHYRVLKAYNQDVIDAFEAAKASGAYHNVMLKTAKDKYKKVEKAYAMNNRFEYFSEITEAYFGSNDFYPFNYQELKEADPKGFALMQKVWGERVEEK